MKRFIFLPFFIILVFVASFVHSQPILDGSLGILGIWEDLTLSGDVTIGDDLTVTDDASIGGDLTVTGNLTVSGWQRKGRTASATNYNPSALTDDYIIAITNTDAARAVVISTEDRDSGSTSNPRIFIIKDESGAAATHNITISLETSGNIDGSANVVISQNYGSIFLYIDGTNGWIY